MASKGKGKAKAAVVTKKPAPESPEAIATAGLTDFCRQVIGAEVLGKATKTNPFGGEAKGLLTSLCQKGPPKVVERIVAAHTRSEDDDFDFVDNEFGEKEHVVKGWLKQLCGNEDKAASLTAAMRYASSLVVPFMRRTGQSTKNYGVLVALVMAAQSQLNATELEALFEEMHRHDGSEEKKDLAVRQAAKLLAAQIAEEQGISLEAATAQLEKLAKKPEAKKKKAKAAEPESESSEDDDDDD